MDCPGARPRRRSARCALPIILAVAGCLALASGCSSGIKGLKNFQYASDGWDMFRNGPSGFASTTHRLQQPVSLLWEKDFKGRLYASPVINNDLGIMPSLNGKVYIFDPSSGDGKGKIKLNSSSSSSPAIAENLMYVAAEKGDGRLRCINVNSGKVVWEFDLQDAAAPIVLHRRSALLGNHQGDFYCFNRFTGDVMWHYNTGGPILGAAAAADRKAFVGSTDGVLYCLRLDDGELLWKFHADEAIYTAPAIGRYCFVTSADRNLYALDPETGNEIWRFTTGGQVLSSPVFDDQSVYFGSNDRFLYRVSQENGELIWKFQTGAVVNSTPLVLADAVVFGSGDKHAYFVDRSSGKKIFSFECKSRIVSSPVYCRDRVYVACTEKRLYCFGGGLRDAATSAGSPSE
jgi:outer membrane protein assembly factor BamB